MLPYYEGKNEPRQKNVNFESARKSFMEEEDKMVVRRRFDRINNMMECKSYIKHEENKGIIIYGFKHIETDKIDNYFLIGCQSDEIFENDKQFNFWSNKLVNKEIEMRSFKITGW